MTSDSTPHPDADHLAPARLVQIGVSALVASPLLLGVRSFAPHALRHRYASMLSMQGVPTRIMQEVLGHSKGSITHDTYSHVLLVGSLRSVSGRCGVVSRSCRAAG